MTHYHPLSCENILLAFTSADSPTESSSHPSVSIQRDPFLLLVFRGSETNKYPAGNLAKAFSTSSVTHLEAKKGQNVASTLAIIES